MWSKPYVGALIYQNLAYLKTAFHTGTIILDSHRATTFEGLMDEIIDDVISRGHMNRDQRENLKSIILSQHRSRSTLAGAITKKAPLAELFSSDAKHSRNVLSGSTVSNHNSVNPDAVAHSNNANGIGGSSFFKHSLFHHHNHNHGSSSHHTNNNHNNHHSSKRRPSFLLAKLAGDSTAQVDGYSSDEKVI